MFLQRRREDELCVWVVLDEARGRETLDGLVINKFFAILTAPSYSSTAIRGWCDFGSVAVCLAASSFGRDSCDIAVGGRLLESLSGVEDGSVSCTSTEVAVATLFDLVFCRFGRVS
jgi:hypothetical protein